MCKSGEKVCIKCAKIIDKNNSHLPWNSEQIKAKNKYISELLNEIEGFKMNKRRLLKSINDISNNVNESKLCDDTKELIFSILSLVETNIEAEHNTFELERLQALKDEN